MTDRSATGYVAPPRFWEIVDAFFGQPDTSILGWETARAAQARIKAGMSATRRIEVDTARTIDFLGENLRVYATPELVRDFEIVCRDLLLEHTDAGEDSVGTGISVTHGGATLRGMHVDITVTVAKIDGRLVTFDLVAKDAIEEISRGSHGRFVVEQELGQGSRQSALIAIDSRSGQPRLHLMEPRLQSGKLR